jgi:hypothetical protein
MLQTLDVLAGNTYVHQSYVDTTFALSFFNRCANALNCFLDIRNNAARNADTLALANTENLDFIVLHFTANQTRNLGGSDV